MIIIFLQLVYLMKLVANNSSTFELIYIELNLEFKEKY
jgi:hypothetical protein